MQISYFTAIMNIRRISAPYQAQIRETQHRFVCESFCDYALSDPVLIIITLTAVIGSFCLLSGLILLCAVSKSLRDQTSEAILLLGKNQSPSSSKYYCTNGKLRRLLIAGIGFFIYTIAFVTWKITNARRIAHVIETLNKEVAQNQV
ncbi:uncharacterized protein LOC101448452 isoform X1 [Ceratitis capitata]|uniref:uncharacterized protein LOC101448452 isoform X1 n=1 Tax=Ceratitis capitata TaxID=7213 RepID=UPI000A11ADC2|nr:uncharacterized protein LOC101448452 isoform X1 [Ceratitis capitata]